MKTNQFLMATLLAAALTGCMVGGSTSTLYLDPDGAVVWTALQTRYRSDARASADRSREEAEWLGEAAAGQGEVARGFRELGASSVRWTLLRGERPYTLLTEASFGSVERLAERLLCGAGLEAAVTLTREGAQRRLRIEIAGELQARDAESVLPFAALEDLRIVLTEGRFVSAEGFRIEEGGSVAVPDETFEPGAPATLALSWRLDD